MGEASDYFFLRIRQNGLSACRRHGPWSWSIQPVNTASPWPAVNPGHSLPDPDELVAAASFRYLLSVGHNLSVSIMKSSSRTWACRHGLQRCSAARGQVAGPHVPGDETTSESILNGCSEASDAPRLPAALDLDEVSSCSAGCTTVMDRAVVLPCLWQDPMVNIEITEDLTRSSVHAIMHVSQACAAHSETRFMSSEIGSCAALAVGSGLIRFCCMMMMRVRGTLKLVRMLVFVYLIHI